LLPLTAAAFLVFLLTQEEESYCLDSEGKRGLSLSAQSAPPSQRYAFASVPSVQWKTKKILQSSSVGLSTLCRRFPLLTSCCYNERALELAGSGEPFLCSAVSSFLVPKDILSGVAGGSPRLPLNQWLCSHQTNHQLSRLHIRETATYVPEVAIHIGAFTTSALALSFLNARLCACSHKRCKVGMALTLVYGLTAQRIRLCSKREEEPCTGPP